MHILKKPRSLTSRHQAPFNITRFDIILGFRKVFCSQTEKNLRRMQCAIDFQIQSRNKNIIKEIPASREESYNCPLVRSSEILKTHIKIFKSESIYRVI